MADLLVQYTAPLPPNYRSGTLTLKRPGVYIDAAGRKAQAVQHGTILADRSVIDVQTGFPMRTIAAADGDPAGPDIDWIETLYVADTQGALLPDPLRQTRRIPGLYTSAGNLNLHLPDEDADLVNGPKLALTIEGVREAADLASEAARVAVDGMREATAATYAAVLEGRAAAAEALAAAGINPAYVSETTADPPAAPNNTLGAKRTADGMIQRLTRTGGVWVPSGSPVMTLAAQHFVDARRYNVAPVSSATVNAAGLQAAIDAAPDGSTVKPPPGTYMADATVYLSNKKNFVLDMTGVTWLTPATLRYAFIVHGGAFSRTADSAAFNAILLESTYEATTPCSGVLIKGLTTGSQTPGSRTTTNLMFFFADDSGVEDLTVTDSQGAGVEYRQSVRPFARRLTVKNWATYGIFLYQCHGFRSEQLRFGEKGSIGGRAWEVKQRHKFYNTLDHEINAEVVDCVGFPAPGANGANPAWATGGVSYLDMASASPAAQAARNFPGHHYSKDVRINATFITSPDAHASVTAPTIHIGPFADRWKGRRTSFDGGGRQALTAPLTVGATGTNGATDGFGQNHEFGDVLMQNISNPGGVPLVDYSVSFKIDGLKARNITTQRILSQDVNSAAIMPFGQVDSVEWLNTDIEVNLLMAANGEQGLRVLADTKSFTTGGNKLVVTPTDNGAGNNTCNPVFIRSDKITCLGGDSITVLANPASVNHAVTYGMYTTATQGTLGGIKFTLYAPVTLRGLVSSNTASTRALTITPSEFILGATAGGAVASGEKTALRTDGPVRMQSHYSANTYSGAWGSQFLDNSDGLTTATGRINTGQNLRNIIWVTALPTTGTYNSGELLIKGSLGLGDFAGWICYRSGTFGSGTDPLFGELAQSGIRKISTSPTFNALFIGERLYDQVAQVYYVAVSVGSGAADWMRASFRLPLSVTLTPPSIPASTTWESANIAVSAAVLNDQVLVAPPGGMTGLTATAYVTTSGQVRVQLANVSAAAIAPASAVYKLTLVKN